MHPNCLQCGLWNGCRTPWIRGRGPIPCDIMLVGEAPGESEDVTGRPFTGRAGKLLQGILDELQIAGRVYISNAVKCRPTKSTPDGTSNRTPTQREVELCRIFLMREVELVQPELLILLGATAISGMLGEHVTNVGSFRLKKLSHNGILNTKRTDSFNMGLIIWATYHPAFALRNPPIREVIKEDIIRAVASLTSKVSAAVETQASVEPIQTSFENTPCEGLEGPKFQSFSQTGSRIWVVDIETNDYIRGGVDKPFKHMGEPMEPQILVEEWLDVSSL